MIDHRGFALSNKPCLSSAIKRGIKVTSWPIEENPSDNNHRPVDDFFTVHLKYYGLIDNTNTTWTLKLKRESSDWQLDVMGWLAELNVDVDAWDCTIDVVVESCESLLSESGRSSLIFKVVVSVEEEDYELMYSDDLDDTDKYVEPIYYIKSVLQDSGVKFVSGHLGGTTNNCKICLEEFGMSNNNVAILPCSHIYHEKCMIRWGFQGKRTCPLCRLEIKL